jgi:predicted ATPase/serine phosphatase RsbU (regulator of sigma subunit)
MLNIPNYQIGTQIYESANSTVYQGIRKKDNQPVILKILKEDYPTPAELTRYRQEYEITTSLNLDGVVKTYGIEKYQNTLVIILEDFGGESLKTTILSFRQAQRPTSARVAELVEAEFIEAEFIEAEFIEAELVETEGHGVISVSDFLSLAIQITEALGNIHAANIIHKDINPANIVWNQETNQLKIIDFGIASRLPRENPTLKNPEQLEGTLAYISPEQTGRMNRSLDYRTDLYSLGVTFYELLTGKVPFESDNALELVHCHIAKTPKPVCEINPNIPSLISDIVMKLMAKNVEDRYQSAFGVKADLEECKLQFAKTDKISHFSLAQNDFSGKLQIPQKLYGRKNEINLLLQAFERVSQGSVEMMLVAGYSGVGKTALVNEVHKPMTEKRGYFAAGKFDQFQKNIPYFAITQAFNQFCRYLLTESAETLANWQTKILEVVSNNGQIIIDVIPDLELVIGPQPAVAEVGPTETQNRFQMFFLNFVKVLCKQDHPFILFIDDLQWVDSASMGLLKSILLDDEIRYLLIIGAYRDNEVDNSHPFMIAVSELQKANAAIHTIELANLQPEDVNHLLQDSLKCEALLSQPLTGLIYQKTQGNAFFTHQFLHALYFKVLLRFDFEQLKWQWNVEQIAAQNITANVVELMASKIGKLSLETIEVLKLAACISNQFDLKTLSLIYQQSQYTTLMVILEALKEGLILPLESHYESVELATESNKITQFKFQHDRVQQAAYALIDDEQKQAVHLQIGRLLLKNTPIVALEEQLFDIVEQFNHSLELLNNQTERLEIAKLNLMAGNKAKAAAAYQPALRYFNRGLKLLHEESWHQQYELMLALHIEGAETAYLNGDFKLMDTLSQTVLEQAQNWLDKVGVYQVKIAAYQAQNQLLNGLNTGLEILKLLGISFPEAPTQADFMAALQETQAVLADKCIETLIDLPSMTDQQQLAAVQILSSIFSASYQAAPAFMPLLVFKQVTLSVQYGNTPESAFAYANYGLILCALVSDIENGYQFGQLALNLLAKFDAKELKARTYVIMNNLVRHWKEHVKESLAPLLEGYQAGLDTGDLEWAAWCIVVHYYHAYLSGSELSTLAQEMARYNETIAKLKQETPLHWQQMYRQAVLNLRGESAGLPTELSGESYNEAEMLPQHLNANDRTMLSHFYLNKIMLCYFFGEYAKAVEYANMAEPYLDGAVGLLVTPYFYCYDSLARLAIYGDKPNPDILAKVSENQAKMAHWAKHAPMNYQHKFYLVEAERCRVLEQDGDAREFYDKAIALAHENKYLNEEALANELASQFYKAKGQTKFAQVCLYESHYLYQQWGATAKVMDLEDKNPHFLTVPPNLRSTVTATATVMGSSTSRFKISTLLDLDSVTKAAQTLAGEIVLSRLLEKMMNTLIENAGAERGLLILEKDKSEWVIEAEGIFDVDEVTILQSIPLSGHLPVSVVNYVIRTREPVVLTNAMQEGIYTEDSYIRQHQIKSVLGSPILHQGQLIGLLYLENNLTEGAFTSARLQILDMLSSQAAISLENALLYRTLEQKVERRTAQLATANKEITKANQEITLLNARLKKENLRMGAELEVAKQLQQMVLPKEAELEQIEELDIAGFMEPADEVGGDYYDVLIENGRVKIGIGDVTGHGLESGVLMLMVQTTVSALFLAGIDNPEQFLNVVNRTIYHNAQRMETDKNLTLSLLDYQEGQLRITGQHEEVLVVRQRGEIERIDTFDLGFSVGVEADIASFVSKKEVHLQPSDGIVLYTDGITEARNPKKKLYGIERLCQVVSQNWHLSAKEIQQAVIADVKQYIDTQKVFDDITLLVLKQK